MRKTQERMKAILQNMCFKNRFYTVSDRMVKTRWSESLKPKLTISGNWMQKAGFTIGSQVKITVCKDKLIIKKL